MSASPVARLRKTKSFRDLHKLWKGIKKGRLHWGGLWGSSKACLTAALASESNHPTLVVTADDAAAELALDDLAAFGFGAVLLPAREGRLGAEPHVLRDRFHALELAHRDGFTGTLVAPLHALIQPAAAPDDDTALSLHQGMQVDPDELLRQLVESGFERVPALGGAGEVARRGDILDFFAPALGEPLRLEFFDDELESIRVIDLGTQRTRHVMKTALVPLAHDLAEVAAADDPLPLEVLPNQFRTVCWEPAAIDDAAGKLRFHGKAHVAALDRVRERLDLGPTLELATLPGDDGTLSTLSVEEYCRGVADGAVLLAERGGDGEDVTVLCSTHAESDRLEQILADRGVAKSRLNLVEGGLAKGFRIPEARITVMHHRELVPGHGSHRPRSRRKHHPDAQPINSVLSLKPGDLVVHAVHGLAAFRGIEPGGEKSGNAVNEASQDVLVLEFDKGAQLNVPVSRVDLVDRYIGSGGSTPTLDRLGSGSFEKRRLKVQAAVEDLAADMLDVQAHRSVREGRALDGNPELQREFEAAFPFEDTPDQAQGTREIHDDLGQPKPMDRLICGDVGYGKTELAARAAFRAVAAGFQVAILVPTTVLAEQHKRSFHERFADHPIVVRHLSRLVTGATRKETLEGLADGTVDIVVGTHRLLSKDVTLANLGLLVIDEEQRFGVRAKELLKRKRVDVDILTLSATPIPRTLHMALAGIRDITSLSTAPTGRSEVHTEIRYDDEDKLIQEAMRAELARGGQIFFVHNRVRSLQKIADGLHRLVPEAKIVTAHGQMEPRELEKAMLAFVRGDADVLCSTTIVESGLDIPNANTIFIHDAQNYGLADMHQLRGRVGRSPRRSFCYLLIPRGQPLPLDARRRLKAIEELRYLGAGFQVALRDLEIRGAGNLLGSEQSGHIAAVGYETYRKLLAQAVARLKRGQDVRADGGAAAADVSLGVEAALPSDYIPDEHARLEVLREFDRVRTPKDVTAVIDAVRDRFGPPPAEAERLARLFFLKHRLGALGLDGIQRMNDRLICTLRDARRLERALRKTEVELRIITPRQAHWMIPQNVQEPDEVLTWVFDIAASCRPPTPRRKSPASKAAT